MSSNVKAMREAVDMPTVRKETEAWITYEYILELYCEGERR